MVGLRFISKSHMLMALLDGVYWFNLIYTFTIRSICFIHGHFIIWSFLGHSCSCVHWIIHTNLIVPVHAKVFDSPKSCSIHIHFKIHSLGHSLHHTFKLLVSISVGFDRGLFILIPFISQVELHSPQSPHPQRL